MYMPDYYEFSCRVNIVTGPHALEQIPLLLSDRQANRPMLVTDKGVAAAGLVDQVLSATVSRFPMAAVADDVPQDSDVETVNRLAGEYRKKGCNALIALGGGSVMDTAKGINILVSEQADDLLNYTGAGALKRPLKLLIAVPTTAGTGSEVTQAAVIFDQNQKRKLIFISPFLQPDAAVIDPRMTMTLPAHITAATAMDALCHAVEAFTMLGKNPLSDAHALEAMTLIREYLLPVIKTPSDPKGRLALATAATMAGIAFSNAMVGPVHALGHSVGSVCHVPHGTCMAVLLPYGLEVNLPKIRDNIAQLLVHLAGPDLYARTPEHLKAEAAIQWIRDLNLTLSQATQGRHPTCLKEIKDGQGNALVRRQDLPAVAKTAMGDPAVLYSAVDLDYEAFLMMAEAAWEGVPLKRS